MITPERAPVKPRVKRKGGDAAYLLEDEIAELVQQGWRGVVLLGGGPGSGKSTALRHLSAVLPPECAVHLVDSDEADAPLRGDVAAAFLSKHAIVLTTMLLAVKPALELEIVPWDQDEWIEFLLSCHPEQCKSVMARLLAGEENRSALYSAEIGRVVLEEMATDDTVASPLDALVCRLMRRFTSQQQWALSSLALASLRAGCNISHNDAKSHVPDLDTLSWRILSHKDVQEWIAAAELREIARQGPQDCASILSPATPYTLRFLTCVARLIEGDDAAISHMQQCLRGTAIECQPTAATVLHLARALPAPRFTMTRSGGIRKEPCLSRAYLAGAQWPGAKLAGTLLRSADFQGANLQRAVLKRADADRADFSGANLSKASLGQTWLESARCVDTNFVGANARGAVFRSTDCMNARFDEAELVDANFRAANLSHASFRHANLTSAYLRAARIDGADFTRADLSRAALDGLNFAAGEFRDARFMGASCKECVLDGVELPLANCDGADFSNATFTAASMPGANLRGANFRGCGLADVDWEGADLRNADLRGAVFSMGGSRSGLVGSPYPSHGTRTGFYTDDFADLSTHKHPEEIRKANLCGVDLRGAMFSMGGSRSGLVGSPYPSHGTRTGFYTDDFADLSTHKHPEEIRKANLCGVDLRGAIIVGVDFYLVDLRGALYDAGQAEQLRRCGAILREPVA